jgi:hypothetical protein
MSRHIDLIAVGALVLAFAFATRVHEVMHARVAQSGLFRVHAINPVVIVPPRMPAVPSPPRWLVQY